MVYFVDCLPARSKSYPIVGSVEVRLDLYVEAVERSLAHRPFTHLVEYLEKFFVCLTPHCGEVDVAERNAVVTMGRKEVWGIPVLSKQFSFVFGHAELQLKEVSYEDHLNTAKCTIIFTETLESQVHHVE